MALPPNSAKHQRANEEYRVVYERVLAEAQRWPLFQVRQRLALMMVVRDRIGATTEALATILLFRGDVPRLVGSDGRVWA